MPSIKEMILSEQYTDIILPFDPDFFHAHQSEGPQVFNPYYGMIHTPLSSENKDLLYEHHFLYHTIPKLFTLLDTENLQVTGISSLQDNPLTDLTGKDVFLGFIDTGIDYTHPAFRNSSGSSRIVEIWDQTIQSGPTPPDFPYGTLFTQQEINQALQAKNPFLCLPSKDEHGHGTMMAGIAAGTSLPKENFCGAAPDAMIAVVKLKPAKNYLRRFFCICDSTPTYQSTDIIMGLKHLFSLARQQKKPLVLCLGLGSNQGCPTGKSALDSMLSSLNCYRGIHTVIAAGNEAGKEHHFYGSCSKEKPWESVEISVKNNTLGFCVEFWGALSASYSIRLESPRGEQTDLFSLQAPFHKTIRFSKDSSRLFLFSDHSFLFLRFQTPTPGIWKILVFQKKPAAPFHLWLPISGFSQPDVTFLRPDPDTTVTLPADSEAVITTAAYNSYQNSLFVNSSRGYSRNGQIKPDLTAPGVRVTAPAPDHQFFPATGTSVSASITAGACAQLIEWELKNHPGHYLLTEELKSILLQNAKQSHPVSYPNREWGYGILNL